MERARFIGLVEAGCARRIKNRVPCRHQTVVREAKRELMLRVNQALQVDARVHVWEDANVNVFGLEEGFAVRAFFGQIVFGCGGGFKPQLCLVVGVAV